MSKPSSLPIASAPRRRDVQPAAPPRRTVAATPARKQVDTLHFERFEFKYLVPESLTAEIARFIKPYVMTDRHAAAQPRGRYTIHNIYLDTPRHDFYRACLDSAVERMKLRVRWYDAEARGPFFLEVKRKVRSVVVKDRVKVSRQELEEIFAPGGAEAVRYHGRADLREFLGRMTYTGARPTIFVKYTREPYESVFGNYARLTFDRAICFQDNHNSEITEDRRAWCYADAGWATKGVRTATILELKMTTEIPRWMSDLVAEFGLERVGFSKYATSIQHRLESAWRKMDTQRRSTVGV